MTLARNQLGRTRFLVTALCIGCSKMGSMFATFTYEVPEDVALATIRAMIARPITFVDTAAADGSSIFTKGRSTYSR